MSILLSFNNMNCRFETSPVTGLVAVLARSTLVSFQKRKVVISRVGTL